MIGLLQRVSEARVEVDGEIVGAIEHGLMVLVGGALLLTPGVMTDIFGFSLILPGWWNW